MNRRRSSSKAFVCAKGHVHWSADAAHVCDVAFAYASRKQLRTEELEHELREVLARRQRQ